MLTIHAKDMKQLGTKNRQFYFCCSFELLPCDHSLMMMIVVIVVVLRDPLEGDLGTHLTRHLVQDLAVTLVRVVAVELAGEAEAVGLGGQQDETVTRELVVAA